MSCKVSTISKSLSLDKHFKMKKINECLLPHNVAIAVHPDVS